MFKRKGLLFVVALFAVASLMAAMSFSSATVNASAKVRITDGSNGLLALGEGSAAKYNGNELVIDLTGNNGKAGLQPGSHYTWENAFKITNNSKETVTVSMPDLKNLDLGNGTTVKMTGNNSSLADGVTLAPGDSVAVNLDITLGDNVNPDDHLHNVDFTVSANTAK